MLKEKIENKAYQNIHMEQIISFSCLGNVNIAEIINNKQCGSHCLKFPLLCRK